VDPFQIETDSRGHLISPANFSIITILKTKMDREKEGEQEIMSCLPCFLASF